MAYETKTVSRFKGINQTENAAELPPEWALACSNVIVDSETGGLEKFRLATDLTSAIGSSGPDGLWLWENASTKKIVAKFGTSIYAFTLDAFTPASIGSLSDSTQVSAVLSHYMLYMQNGVISPTRFDGTTLYAWGIAQSAVPAITSTASAGAITLVTGRRYMVAFKNAVGDVGAASTQSASTGAITAKMVGLSVAVPNDAQITKARVYSTLDGGSVFYFNEEKTATPNSTLTWNDNTTDAALTQTEEAPLYNFPPPKAKYLAKWGSRIFGFNITSEIGTSAAAPASIFYTGYEVVLVGRPETSVPLGNRLNLSIGADELAGGGAIAAGIIAFDVTNKMWMFRGQPEDITSTDPLDFSLFLQELPWQIGCVAHSTIQSTPCGLVWLTPDREVRRFDGQGEPVDLSMGIRPIMRRAVQAQLTNARSGYWSVNGRIWYVLAIAVDSSSWNNLLLFFDLEPNPELNIGVFPVDVGRVDAMVATETVSAGPKYLIGRAGILSELALRSTTTNAVTTSGTSTAGTLAAYWQSAYFGSDSPMWRKMFRFGRLLANSTVAGAAGAFQVAFYLVDDETYPLASPLVVSAADLNTASKFSVNKVSRRLSIRVNFPSQDQDAAIQQLSAVWEKLSEF